MIMYCKKILKKIGVALLSATILFMPINVHAQENEENVYDQWKTETLLYPNKGQVVPAGYVHIQFLPLMNSDFEIESYDVYFDGEKQANILDDGGNLEYSIYTTQVSSHTTQVVAITKDNKEIHSNIRTFFVSKKGVAYEHIDDIEDLSASWYYNWGTTPSGADTDLEFVPMVWGLQNYKQNLQSIKEQGLTTVLGYNEPEGIYSGQSNISVEDAVKTASDFTDSGLRIGSPAIEHVYDQTGWLKNYMEQLKETSYNVDFIAVHEYFYNICNCDPAHIDDTKNAAIEFLDNLQKLYDAYQKPIWITEFAVVNNDQWWKHYSYTNEAGKEEVYQFMNYVINGIDGHKGLDELDYVERYAWFPFDTRNEFGGASSLFVTKTDSQNDVSLKAGELTRLGQLYRSLGNPDTNIDVEDQSIYDFVDYTVLDELIKNAENIVASDYYIQHYYCDTVQFEKILKQAKDVSRELPIHQQKEVNEIANSLEKEMNNLVLKNADYSHLHELLNTVREYMNTHEDCQSLMNTYQEALNLDTTLTIVDQKLIDDMYIVLEKEYKNVLSQTAAKPDEDKQPSEQPDNQPNKEDDENQIINDNKEQETIIPEKDQDLTPAKNDTHFSQDLASENSSQNKVVQTNDMAYITPCIIAMLCSICLFQMVRQKKKLND